MPRPGAERGEIDKGIASFAGLPHRLQPAGQIDNILFVNDSKATNGEAAARALASFENIHWCAGGIAKEDGLDACIPHLSMLLKAICLGPAQMILPPAWLSMFRLAALYAGRGNRGGQPFCQTGKVVRSAGDFTLPCSSVI